MERLVLCGAIALLAVIACAHDAAPPAPPVVALDQTGTYRSASSEGSAATSEPRPQSADGGASARSASASVWEDLAARRAAAEAARRSNTVGSCKSSAECPDPASCEHGACVCPPRTQACGGKCISLFDSQHCGECGKVCSVVCLDHFGTAQCGACDPPYAACSRDSGQCANLDRDGANCGACGKTCGKGSACARGRCVVQHKLGASCTSDEQCEALPGSCVDGRCDCTGSYRAQGGRCVGSSF